MARCTSFNPASTSLSGAQAPPPEEASLAGQLTVVGAERRTVNMTHPELVPLILDIWGVEHAVFAEAQHHHAPQRAKSKAIQASILQLADLLANHVGVGLSAEYGFASPAVDKTAAKLNVGKEVWEGLLDSLGWAVAGIAAEIEET